MADISMCLNKDCPLSWNCWRFNAPTSHYQSYDNYAPDENGKCDAYEDMDERRSIQKRVDAVIEFMSPITDEMARDMESTDCVSNEKPDVMSQIKQGLEEVKEIQDGNLKAESLKEFFDKDTPKK